MPVPSSRSRRSSSSFETKTPCKEKKNEIGREGKVKLGKLIKEKRKGPVTRRVGRECRQESRRFEQEFHGHLSVARITVSALLNYSPFLSCPSIFYFSIIYCERLKFNRPNYFIFLSFYCVCLFFGVELLC